MYGAECTGYDPARMGSVDNGDAFAEGIVICSLAAPDGQGRKYVGNAPEITRILAAITMIAAPGGNHLLRRAPGFL